MNGVQELPALCDGMTTISNGGTATIGERSSILGCLSTHRHARLRGFSPHFTAICHLAKSSEEGGPLLRGPPTAGVQRATRQAGPNAPTTLAVQESPFSGIGLGLRSSHSVLMVDGGWRRGIQHRSRYEVLVSGRVAGMPLVPEWSLPNVRGKVDLNFRIAAIRSKRDESRQTIPSALIQASPTINVAFQDGSVLLCREWASLVQTLALVVRQLCRKNCGLS